MAGIGVKLNKIYEKQTITTGLYGIGYSAVVTVAPMFLVILSIVLMQLFLDGFLLGYSTRLLFSVTVLYIFIFSLLTVAPFNAVLSKYLSDVIYNETYEDILPCYYVGLAINTVFSSVFGIPFACWAYFRGGLDLAYVFVAYCGFMLLVVILYSMIYMSIFKDYKKISFFYLLGSLTAVILSVILVRVFHWETAFAMLFSLTVGFFITAALKMSVIRAYFHENSGKYREVFRYLGTFWKLIAANSLYMLGMYIHNFVFWTTDLRIVVADTFVCVLPYDMATCLAMFTNISSSVIFISRMEMHFHSRYKGYSEAVIGGRWKDICNAKNRMFRQLTEELMNLLRIQFIISVVIYLLAVIFLPRYGYGGLVMRIYPCMAAGYFILFMMYAALLYLYFFDDLKGALATTAVFCATTWIVSVIATGLPDSWYGIGVTVGALAGWTVGYFRLRWLEKNVDIHTFCTGNLLKKAKGAKPSAKVYDRKALEALKTEEMEKDQIQA